MCIIAIKKSGIDLPKSEHLLNCESKNNDGVGVALLRNGTQSILIKKDFDNASVLIDWLHQNVTTDDTCIIHFRYATHGLKDKGNRHPFPITRDREKLRLIETEADMIMAHNGVISDYRHHDTFSDTQKFIMDILADEDINKSLDSKAVRKLISNFIGNDRVVILNKDNTLYLFGEWINSEGILYSNTGYQFYYRKPIDDWRDYEERWSGFKKEEINKKIEDDINASVVSKKKDKLTNSEYWVGECEACKKTGLKVSYVSYGSFSSLLCKSCRRKLVKAIKNNKDLKLIEFKDKEKEVSEEQQKNNNNVCESCQLSSSKPLVYWGGQKICEDCLIEVQSVMENYYNGS